MVGMTFHLEQQDENEQPDEIELWLEDLKSAEVTPKYTARVVAVEDGWSVHVHEINLDVLVLSIDEIEPATRQLIATAKRVDPESFLLVPTIYFPADA
jgi:hypothetical protein